MTDARASRSTTIRLRGWIALPSAVGVVTKSRWIGRSRSSSGRHVHAAPPSRNAAVLSAVKATAFDRRVPAEMGPEQRAVGRERVGQAADAHARAAAPDTRDRASL